MSAVALAAPGPRRGRPTDDRSGVRLPVIQRRIVPVAPPRRPSNRSPLGGPPLRAA